jgi:autotransporter-associated beta strand protein
MKTREATGLERSEFITETQTPTPNNMNHPMKTALGAAARRSALLLTAVFLPCLLVRANIVGPYTPDTNTLYLFHFDEPVGSSLTTNVGIKGGNCITVTNTTANPGLALPPTVTTMLGKTSYTGFGNCVSATNTVDPTLYPTIIGLVGYDGNNNGVYNADINGTAGADAIAMTNLNIGNSNAFTIEALVNCATNLGGAGVNQEIVCTDNANGPQRGFQFRINNNAQLEFNFIGAPGSGSKTAAIPTTGPHAFAVNTWFHAAVTYDGTNLLLYWTKLDPSSAACNQIGGPFAWNSTTNGQTVAPLAIGNENRGASTENFKGLIDELRISSVCRGPGQMMFTNAGVVIVKQPSSQSIDYFQPVTFSVTASSPTPMGYRWRFNQTPIPSDTATNSSYTIPSVDLTAAGNYDVVITNTAGYAATSSPALLIVGSDHFLAHRWSFNSDTLTNDSVGGATGTNMGTATISGGALVLDGSAGCYMELPHFLIHNSNYTAVTFEFWANYNTSGNNDRIFDFGNTNFVNATVLPPENYVFFSPHAGANHLLGLSPTTSESQISATGTGNLDGQNMYVACVVDPPNNVMTIYTNGVFETSATISATLDSVLDQKCWIGRSLFAADSYLNGSIDELRVYSGALSPASVAQSYVQGPNVPLNAGPVSILVQPTNTTGAVGFPASIIAVLVGKAPISAQWYENGSPITGATNPVYTFIPALSQNNHFFQVLATNVVSGTNYSVASSNATLTVIIPPKLVWLGQNSSAWDTSTLNWTNVSTASLVPFSAFASALFDDRGSGQPTVNLTQALNPVTVTVASSTSYSFVSSGGNGSLTGVGTLTKSNGNTLIIDVTNGMTGSVMISGGTLQVGNGDTLGAIGSPVTNNASLVLARSDSTVMSSPIYGTGTVTMASGNVTASGASYYTGNTLINSGVTMLGNATGLGATNGSITVADGAELYITANVDVGLNPLVIGGTGVSGVGALRKGGAGTTTCYGTVTLTEDTTMNVDGGATLNLTNSAGVVATNNYLYLAGSGAGNITGPLSLGSFGGLTVNGGTWTVAPSNNFSGLITLYGGALRITGVQSLGPVPANFNASQIILSRGTLEAATNITLNDGKIGINVTDNSGIAKDAGVILTISNRISSVNASVNLTNAGPGTLILNGANSFNGTLFMDTGSQTANDGMVVIANNAAIANIPAFTGLPYIIFRSQNSGSSTLALDGTLGSITVAPDITLSGRTTPSIENLAGNNTISGSFTLSAGGSYILQSDSGTLTLTANWPYAVATNIVSTRSITFQGVGTITMSGAIQDVLNSFVSTNVPISVLKSGSGVLSLPVVNAYSGTTIVSNGVLSLTGTIGTNTVAVAGGLLVGNGAITGPVTVQAAGAIEAGATNTIGTLHLASTLTLSGNTIVKINKATSAADLFSGQTSVTYGGTLTVTNLAGTLTTNDTFTLFTPGASASNFANIVGSPGPGLKYTFTNGILSVAVGSNPVPHITSISLSGTTLTISGTNGAGGGQYVLLGSTNVARPLSQWTPLLTNYFDVNGNINLSTNIVNLALPLEFYLLSQ